MRNNIFSVVLLSYNSKENIVKIAEAIRERFDREKIDYELIIIDDASEDESFEIALNLEKADSRVRAYQLSKNVTSHYSIFAGFSLASGDCAIAIPDDFQVPIDTVVEMYRHWENGLKVVVPYRDIRKDHFFSRLSAAAYYKLMNSFSDIAFPKGGADIFLADREVIDILNERIHARNTSTIAEVLRLGFDPIFIPMKRDLGTNRKSRWTLKAKWRLAVDTFIASSSFPIKFVSVTGVGSFLGAIVLIVFYICSKLFGFIDVPGWTLLVIYLSFFSGLNLLCLGVIAEYVWRIFDEVKGRPGFIIRKKE